MGLTLEHCSIALDESDNNTDLDGDEGEVDGDGSYPSGWLRRLRKGITKIRCLQTVLGKSEEYRHQRNLKVTFILDLIDHVKDFIATNEK
ncbi:hypothetical protein BGZ92_004723 [Podila epicladia]|nr:hypothetical protein BGZ92_004723 [Podila epicladia]